MVKRLVWIVGMLVVCVLPCFGSVTEAFDHWVRVKATHTSHAAVRGYASDCGVSVASDCGVKERYVKVKEPKMRTVRVKVSRERHHYSSTCSSSVASDCGVSSVKSTPDCGFSMKVSSDCGFSSSVKSAPISTPADVPAPPTEPAPTPRK